MRNSERRCVTTHYYKAASSSPLSRSLLRLCSREVLSSREPVAPYADILAAKAADPSFVMHRLSGIDWASVRQLRLFLIDPAAIRMERLIFVSPEHFSGRLFSIAVSDFRFRQIAAHIAKLSWPLD